MQTGRSLPVEFFKAISERVRFERVLGPIGRMTLRDEVFLGLVVAAIVFPLISIRAYHYEEGLTAALAKDALSGSPWYVPDLFGARWIERPVMQSWIAAAISWPLGGVSQISVRLPTVAALFAGALLIWGLVRPRVSRPAALVAALCFLFSPAVLQKAVTAEADILLSAFEFAAFVVWWRGYEAGRVGARALARRRPAAGGDGSVQGTAARCLLRARRRRLHPGQARLEATAGFRAGRRRQRRHPRVLVCRRLPGGRRRHAARIYAAVAQGDDPRLSGLPAAAS